MGARKWVFAVHKWETADDKHHVSFGKGKKYKTRTFTKWGVAQKFAESKAKAMGMKQYQIDTPSRPHTMVKVKPTRSPKKKVIKRKSRGYGFNFDLGI